MYINQNTVFYQQYDVHYGGLSNIGNFQLYVLRTSRAYFMLPFSLDCPFFIATSVFSNIYYIYLYWSWIYNDQIGRVGISLTGLNPPHLVVTTFFSICLEIDLIFGMRVYNDKLQINFEIHSGWMIFGQLTAIGL